MQEATQEIVQAHEVLTSFEDGKFNFTEIFFREKGKLYYTTQKIRLFKDTEIPIFDINHSDVFPVPPTAYQAEWFDGITSYEAPDPIPTNVYVKTPALYNSDPTGSRSMASSVQPEVKILEIIKADKDRRNSTMLARTLANTMGVYRVPMVFLLLEFVSRGTSKRSWTSLLRKISELKRITVSSLLLTFRRLSTDPKKIAEYALPAKPEQVIEGLIKGIQYLHGLGLIRVHSDINPRNIMFDEDGRPVIIDFDTCVRRGEETAGGTYGWMDGPDFPTTATDEIDIRGFYRVVIFMHEKFTLDGLELPPHYDGVDDDFAHIKKWLMERIDCVKIWLRKEGERKVDLL